MNEKRNGETAPAEPVPVRCAVYTRKSTTEGLDSNFSSLDAQREACEAFIKSQSGAGWRTIPIQYDDGGFTGGNTDRPAFQQMIADIKDGKIDCVVVYKVDRLSRSLLDFAKMMEIFDRYNVSFVSITQQFNTATSMGRLVLNVLLSFAQFEREIISERTRDKIAASRKKGKWVGGYPVLGYDIDPLNRRLIVNEKEKDTVRAVFDIFIETSSLSETLERLNEMGCTTKTWTTRKGKAIQSRQFNRARLICMLSNPLYIGKVPYKGEMYAGEHEAIIDLEMWSRAQDILSNGCAAGRSAAKTKQNGLLSGVIRCVACNAPMTRTYAMKKGRRYHYYVCSNAHKNGWKSCPVKSVNADDIENFVAERLREIGDSKEMMERITTQAEEKSGRHAGIDNDILRLERTAVSQTEVETAFSLFGTIWEILHPKEQSRIAHLIMDRVDYGGPDGTMSISFNTSGIRALAAEMEMEKQSGDRGTRLKCLLPASSLQPEKGVGTWNM
jgi:site-specific DNA recombinase